MPSRSEAQRNRAKAQRATAARVRNRQTILPKSITRPSKEAQIAQAYRWLNGTDPMPRPDTPEAKQAARMASLARWQKADPAFQAAFAQYWYHDEGAQLNEDEELGDFEDEDE